MYYKAYSKILFHVIKEAKRMIYNTRILKFNYKSKTTWNIINKLLGKQHSTNEIQKLSIDNNHVTKRNDIADSPRTYYASMENKMNNN